MFQKAVRKQAKLKIAVTGPSGSGKTYSALLMAKAMGKKIAVVDTENKSASLYAGKDNLPEFDSCDLEPPYTTDKYIAAIKAAVDAGYDVLIIDSISHQWAGEGGVLQKKERLDSQPGSNSYTNWGKLTPEQERFKSAILHADIHLIVTMRSKQDHALVIDNQSGKTKVQKLGLAPIQRDGMEYEFTSVFDIAMNHDASVSKDRTSLFPVDQPFRISEATGKAFMSWLSLAAPLTKTPPKVDAEYPQVAGFPCVQCGGEINLVSRVSGEKGYSCKNFASIRDGHARFEASKLEEMRLKYAPEFEAAAQS